MADKQLQKVRTKFVDKVSQTVISQLLDGLLEDFVLNDGEREAIVEGNSIRADQARSLIDTVKNKGDCASRRMITHLKSRDPHFFVTLGLTLQDPAEPKEQSWSDTLQTTTHTFWIEKQNDPDNYPVTKESIGNRIALLITNIDFKDQRIEDREGAKKDVENMERLLSSLGYEVVKHTNLTGKEIDSALMSFSQHSKLAHTDSVFVVIMSHGKLGAVLGVDYTEEKPDEFLINNIYQHLGTQNCPSLVNKPKVIIIQACRGVGTGSVYLCNDGNAGVTSDGVPQSSQQLSADGGSIEDDGWQIKHNERDFTSLLSCTPDNQSYRCPIEGSIMIQSTVKVFNTFAYKKHIEELFTLIIRDVAKFSDGNTMQIPTKDRHTLLKNFYLYPGI
ncbi:caspase-1-like [Sphaeramia orbicularis]|uniref:Caspase-1-like n=1 Tax=Sphaeramia orbicularis TaxID=375764 RepID=A0A673BBB1_9TELE|nr:caspase-1-like [Sphaeramia orbicularis]